MDIDTDLEEITPEYMLSIGRQWTREIMAAMPIEERLEGLTVKERLTGIPLEELFSDLSPEEFLQGLSQEQITRLKIWFENNP